MEEITDYMDDSKQVHNLPVKLAGVSENGPLFTATYILFKLLDNNAFIPLFIFDPDVNYDSNTKQYHADPPTKGSHFSHDNMTGLYIHHYCSHFHVASLPIIKWNKRLWLHPRDILFYSMMKGSRIASILALFTFPIMIAISLLQRNEKTSGKCLWLLRLLTLMIHRNTIVSAVGHLLFKFANLFKREQWHTIFTRYYTYNMAWSNYGHPTLETLKNISFLGNELDDRFEEK